MERLSGQDATFLYTETRRTPFEIGTCLILDTRGHETGEASRVRLRDQLATRLHLAPRMRQRVLRVPLDLHHPVWVDDDHFDLDYHVRRGLLPSPGTPDQLRGFVNEVLSRPLDHGRPLWELYLIDGLEEGRSALLIKTHHAAFDGLAGFQVLTALVDLEPTPDPDLHRPQPWSAERAPSTMSLLLGAGVDLAREPLAVPRGVGRLVRDLVATTTTTRTPAEVLGASMAPPSLFNDRLSNRRSVHFFEVSLNEVLAVKQAAGVKLNDVALAMVGGGLRRYLDRHDHPTTPSLVTYLPVTLRSGGEGAGNHTTVVSAHIGTDVADPLERLASLAAQTRSAKERAGGSEPPLILDISAVTGPAVGAFLERLAVAVRTTEILRLAGNLVVSNVASVPFPLFALGASVESVYPIGPISDGVALNFTLLSYEGSLCFSMLTDPTVVTDHERLLEDCLESWAELRSAVLG